MEKARIIQFSKNASFTNFSRKQGELLRSQPMILTTTSKIFSLLSNSSILSKMTILLMKQSTIIILRSLRIEIARYSTCIEESVKIRFRILQRQVDTKFFIVPSKWKMLRTSCSLQSQGHRMSKTGIICSKKLQRRKVRPDDALLKPQLKRLSCRMLSICDWKSSGSWLLVRLYLWSRPTTILVKAEYIDSDISFSSLTCNNSQNQPNKNPIQLSHTSKTNLSLLQRLASRHPTSTSSLSNPQLPALSQNQATKLQISGVRCVLGHSLSASRFRMMFMHLMRSVASLLLLPRNPPMQFTKKVISSVQSSSASPSSLHQIRSNLLKLMPLNSPKLCCIFLPSCISEKTLRQECCSTSISSPSNSLRFIAKYSSSQRCLISFLIEFSLAATDFIIIIFQDGTPTQQIQLL